jgi:cellulose synthase/poly-beta-1,6-N-acetylglucosamine synthase-like glycosyltransferase
MMVAILTGFVTAAILLLIVPVVVFLAQVVASRGKAATEETGASVGSLAVLMPAHDEAAGISGAIRALVPQLGNADRLLVIADNCSDDTAAVARTSGAEVTVRVDPVLRGKGYALDHGIRHLSAAPPDAVVIVDADCVVAAGALELLRQACLSRQRPVQALYLMRARPEAGLRQRMAAFAWRVRNEVRPSGWHRLGLPCQLMGTGMAFPWPLIATASLASGSIVEDMQLGIHLALAGAPPTFCPLALVTSTFPESSEGTLAQRTRWEHGHLGMIAAHGLPLLWRGVVRRRLDLIAMALDLCVPPLASLVLMLALVAMAAAVLASLGGGLTPLVMAIAALAVMILATGFAWSQVGRTIVSLPELLSAPVYAFAKIPIYVRLFTARQRQWIRTRRDGDR